MITINADDLPRFMTCNGSRLMAGEIPPSTPVDTTARDEGTAAHYMAAVAFSGHHTVDELVDRKAPNGTYMTSEMAEHVDGYLQLIKSHLFSFGVEIETSHDHSPYWAVNGRADWGGLIAEDHLHIIDFKYGYRATEPENNWTLISHALGLIARRQQNEKPLQRFSFSIYQPRPYHPEGKFRTWTISANELNDAAQTLARTLSNPTNELRTSNHCGNCPALVPCPAARLAQFNAIEATHTVFSDKIDNRTLAQTLDLLSRAEDMIKDRLKAFEELAQHRIKTGQVVDNYSVEMRYHNTRWKEGFSAEMLKLMTGKDLAEQRLVTPAEAKRRGVNKEIIGTLTERLPSGVKLVRIDPNKKAAQLFEGKKGN